jgi:NAD(P)-dependent dehydrogenase (short-subunit alcohol dehydrogenase family)
MNRKIALVTGAGSGIGRSVAVALAQRQYRLVLAGRRLDALQTTAALLGLSPEDVCCVSTDVTDRNAVNALFDTVRTRFGRLDLLFNNAGISTFSTPVDAVAAETWLNIINTNLNGAFWCLQAAFALMKTQQPMGGRIINNGSISSMSPRPGSIAYTASKHAVTGLTKATALDGRPWNIACCQIDIGNAASDMGNQMAKGVPQANGTLMKEPVMDVAHVGEAVCYMDSLPLEANVQFMTLMATQMPFIGRG